MALIFQLLQAMQLPHKAAIIHCKGHQTGQDPIATGNNRADQEAKAAAMRDPPAKQLLAVPNDITYEPEERHSLLNLEARAKGPLLLPQRKYILPEKQTHHTLQDLHIHYIQGIGHSCTSSNLSSPAPLYLLYCKRSLKIAQLATLYPLKETLGHPLFLLIRPGDTCLYAWTRLAA